MISGIKNRWNSGGIQRAEILATILFCIALIPSLRGISEQSDVDIFFGAANRLRSGTNMYLAPYMYGMWYYYSPLFASILVPFTWLDIRILKLVWYLFNLFLVFRCYKLSDYFIPFRRNEKAIVFLVAYFILSVHSVFLNLLYGQLTIFVLWCCLEGVYRFYNKQNTKGALSFALGINVKMLPVFFFYFYFVKYKWKEIFYIGLALVFLILIPYLWLPFRFHSQLIYNWLDLLNPLNSEHVNTVGEGGFTDFASLVTKYLTFHTIPGESTMHIANLNVKHVFIAQTAFRLLILFYSAWVILRAHPAILTGKIKEWADAAFVLACIPTAFPHQRDYSVLLCLPAMLVLLHLWFQGKTPVWIVVMTILAATMMGSVVFFELFGNRMKFFLYQSRLCGFGVLLFIPAYILWISRFKSSANSHESLVH